jgi:hypothetical protein
VWKELDIETEFAADPDAHAMALAMRDQHTDRVTKKPAPTDEAKGPEPEPQQGDIPFPGDKK